MNLKSIHKFKMENGKIEENKKQEKRNKIANKTQ